MKSRARIVGHGSFDRKLANFKSAYESCRYGECNLRSYTLLSVYYTIQAALFRRGPRSCCSNGKVCSRVLQFSIGLHARMHAACHMRIKPKGTIFERSAMETRQAFWAFLDARLRPTALLSMSLFAICRSLKLRAIACRAGSQDGGGF
jgi:hypothetical protein